jgi:archaemetzincin
VGILAVNLHIHILLFEATISRILEEVEEHLCQVFFGSRCSISHGDPSLLEKSYNRARGQYHSSRLLAQVGKVAENLNAHRILAVVPVDLYVPGLNFIFGEAQCPGRLAIISTHRLRPEFYGKAEDGSLFLSRVKKEATHELGHTLGLTHCSDPTCVMFFSNSIQMTDRKKPIFCPVCERQLRENMSRLRFLTAYNTPPG